MLSDINKIKFYWKGLSSKVNYLLNSDSGEKLKDKSEIINFGMHIDEIKDI